MTYPKWKRTSDIIGATTGLIILFPFAPIILLAIRLETPGNPIVSLERISEGKTIKVYKFRSMIKDAHNRKEELSIFNERSDGPFFKMTKDPRVTRVGRVLRKTRIDEYPQFINVLKGELAIVGPRPHERIEVEKYPSEFVHIPNARGGITGISQVNGASGLPYLKELELDSHYIDNCSPILDFKIISKSVRIFLFDHTAV